MSGTSAYIHSNLSRAKNMSVSTSIIDSIQGNNSDDNSFYVDDTREKLQAIQQKLRNAEDAFLEGYSTDKAQDIAQSTNKLLVQMANDVLNGTDAYEMATALTQNKRINKQKLKAILESNVHNEFEQELVSKIVTSLREDMGTGELATALAKTLSGNQTVITVTEAGSQIQALGSLLNVNKINASFRKGSPVINIMSDTIFKTSKDLVTKKTGVYRNMIRELFEASGAVTRQSFGSAINNFCIKLNKKMKELVPVYMHFITGSNKEGLYEEIDKFTENLKPALREALQDKANKEMFYKSNVIGIMGEEVRSTVSQVGDSTIISFVMGDTTEDAGVERINQLLHGRGVNNSISKMNSYHGDSSQSLTDLVLLNTNNNMVARAQSKDHFVSYFTKERDESISQIENFRWMVADDLNLFNYLQNLSNDNLGIGLNAFNLETIMEAMANNLWFQYHDSAYPEGGAIGFSDASVEDFQKELEGSLEKLLAGQVTNLLGVTVAPSGMDIIPDASNIFYLLNGRLKRTSDLIEQAIQQLRTSENLKLSENKGRMVIVNLDGSGVKSIGVGKKSDSFLVQKLRNIDSDAAIEQIGQKKGEEVISAIKINVSLGTSIDNLRRSSLTMF